VTCWPKSIAPEHFVDVEPSDNVLFETDFLHTACLFGNVLNTIERTFGRLDETVRRKIFGGNATKLHGIQEAPSSWRDARAVAPVTTTES
jgi:hypothetical protein